MYISKYNEIVKEAISNQDLKCEFKIFTIDGVEIEFNGFYLGHVDDHRYHCYYDVDEDIVFTFNKEKIIFISQRFISELTQSIMAASFSDNIEPIIPISIDTVGNFDIPLIQDVKYNSITENSNWIRFDNKDYAIYWLNRRNIVCFS